MAILKTVTIKNITYVPAMTAPKDPVTEPPTLWINKEISVDDPDDDQLPITKSEVVKYIQGDDVSGEEPLVQNIFNAIFN